MISGAADRRQDLEAPVRGDGDIHEKVECGRHARRRLDAQANDRRPPIVGAIAVVAFDAELLIARGVAAGEQGVMHPRRAVLRHRQNRQAQLRPELVARARLEAIPDVAGVMDGEGLPKVPGVMGEEIDHLAAMGIDDPQLLAALQMKRRPFAALDDRHDASPIAGRPPGSSGRGLAGQKYIVCNADEGDSGTYADRMLMEGDPFTLIEGMTIAGLAVGAEEGFVYIRSEYPHAFRQMQRAVEIAREGGWLGANVAGSGKRFDIQLRLGAGAYICGEETSLLESLEGKRGVIRYKPPLPAIKGLFGKPTVINNVISLASVPIILDRGAAFYRDFGMGRSRGTLPFQLAGNVKHGGLVEKAFGLTLRQLIEDFGGGTATGRPLRAVQVGGPLGAYFPASLLDTPLDYEAFAAEKGMVGHGGVVVFDDSVDLARQARFAMEFCAIESCGKCTPCRIGSTRGVEVIDKIAAGKDRGRPISNCCRNSAPP